MKKRLLGISLVSVFSMLNGCGSQTSEMVTPVVIESATTTPDQASANSIFQPERRITSIVAGIFSEYDHNQNGTIDYRTTATTYNDYYRSNENNSYSSVQQTASINGSVPRSYIRIYTRNTLFLASDKNNDGLLTTEELISFITEKYDTNNDDILSSRGIAFWQAKDEYNLFNNDYKETFFRKTYI